LVKQEPLTAVHDGSSLGDEDARDAITAEEVFELIRNLNDPEHPLTLEQLKVASVSQIE